MFLKNVFFIVVPTGKSWSENLVKTPIFCLRSFEKKTLSFSFHLFAGRQGEKVLFSDALAIVESYVQVFAWFLPICLYLSDGPCDI
jgi:hypothetical protein